MAIEWQRKGVDDYRQEVAEKADDEKLRIVLTKYANDSVNIESLLPSTRSILADCLMLRDCDKNIASKKIRKELQRIQKHAVDLSDLIRDAYPEAAKLLKSSAGKDASPALSHLERGDPFARDDRLQDAATMIGALSEWAEVALEAFMARKAIRPKLILPSYAGSHLAGIYQRLTLRKPTRSNVQSREKPYGQIEGAEFGRFSKDLLSLIDMELSDPARTAAIAKSMVKSSRNGV